MKKPFFFFAFFVFSLSGFAQNPAYARKIVDTLCSPHFAGRGYLKNGDFNAAEFIKAQFTEIGLKPFGSYYQQFGFPINTFPTDPELSVDGYELELGKDFIVTAGCRSVDGVFEIVWVDSETVDNAGRFKRFVDETKFRKSILVVNALSKTGPRNKERLQSLLQNEFKAAGIVEIVDKLTWSASTRQEAFPHLQARAGVIRPTAKFVKIQVFSQVNTHQTQNVVGYIKGVEVPDSFIVFTAHYDHLGMMGKTLYFPGANDNASGVAMLLDFASYYATHKSKYSIAFIAFAGEEPGLLGSYYFTQHPLIRLPNIRFLINMDLMGTGSKGMTAVNATVFPNQFNKLEIANISGSYLSYLNQRGKAQNSDHYFFTEMGVPSFFFYLMGEYSYYHDPDDKAENLPMEKYSEAFLLIRDFVKELELP